DELIARILYLEGTPNVQKLGKVNVGQTVPEQLRLDREGSRHHAEPGDRDVPEPRGPRQPRPAGGHPEIGRRARQLDRSPAHAHRASRRRQLPLPADQERRRLNPGGKQRGSLLGGPRARSGGRGQCYGAETVAPSPAAEIVKVPRAALMAKLYAAPHAVLGGVGIVAMNGPAVMFCGLVAIAVSSPSTLGRVPM